MWPLGDDVSLLIFSHFTVADLPAVASTCKYFSVLVRDQVLWSHLAVKPHPYVDLTPEAGCKSASARPKLQRLLEANPGISHLDLSWYEPSHFLPHVMTTESVCSLISAAPNLTYLDLSNRIHSGEVLRAVTAACGRIAVLKVGGYARAGDSGQSDTREFHVANMLCNAVIGLTATLTQLDISSRLVTPGVLSSIAGASHLTSLCVDYCPFSAGVYGDRKPSTRASVSTAVPLPPSLTALSATGAQWALSAFTNLRQLRALSVHVTTANVASLHGFTPNLTSLNIEGFVAPVRVAQLLATLPSLTSFETASYSFTCLSGVAESQAPLRSLTMSGLGEHDEAVEVLQDLGNTLRSSLTELSLVPSNIDDSALIAVLYGADDRWQERQLPLRSLRIGNDRVTAAKLAKCVATMRSVTALELTYGDFSLTLAREIGSCLTCLTDLHLPPSTTNNHLQSLAGALGRLRRFVISPGSLVSGVGLEYVAAALPTDLDEFNISATVDCDDGIRALADRGISARYFNLSYTQLTDSGALALAECLRLTTELNIADDYIMATEASGVEKVLHKILENAPRLQTLEVGFIVDPETEWPPSLRYVNAGLSDHYAGPKEAKRCGAVLVYDFDFDQQPQSYQRQRSGVPVEDVDVAMAMAAVDPLWG